VDDLISDGENCAVFDPADELSIYSSLQKLLDSPELARRLASGAQQYLRENHSVSKMVAEIIQAYRDAERWYRP
jgi:glycosyltransferase involved in cell wall biosynthesis